MHRRSVAKGHPIAGKSLDIPGLDEKLLRAGTAYRAARAFRTLDDFCADRKQRLQILTFTGLPLWNSVCLWTLA